MKTKPRKPTNRNRIDFVPPPGLRVVELRRNGVVFRRALLTQSDTQVIFLQIGHDPVDIYIGGSCEARGVIPNGALEIRLYPVVIHDGLPF